MNLRETLEEIGSTRFSSTDLEYFSYTYAIPAYEPEATEYGTPLEITDGDYGQFFDFETYALEDGRYVFYADSEAAWKWITGFMPNCQPRYKDRGFIIDHHIERLVERAEKAKLTDRRMAENERVG